MIGHTHHQFDRRSATSASSTRARSGCRTKARSPRSGRSSRTASRRSGARRSTSSAPSPRRARAPGRTPGFVDENLLVAVDARRGDRAAGEPARVRVRIGRVGRPHGLDGSFVVEQRATTRRWWKTGARFLAAGGRSRSSALAPRRPARDQARPARRARRASRSSATRCRRRTRTSTTPSSSSASRSWRRAVARSERSRTCPRASRTTCSSSTPALLPMVEDCVRDVDLDGGRIIVAAGSRPTDAARRLHARPARVRLAHRAAPGRDGTRRRARPAPLLATATRRRCARRRSTTSRTAAAPGMVLRVDVVAAALDAAYGGAPAHR